jgi:hypothetical protein
MIRPVKYIKVSVFKEDTKQSFSDVTKSGTHSRLSSRMSEEIKKITVKDGDLVKKDEFSLLWTGLMQNFSMKKS